jgi:CubicO group peptidase (beta-lactamase class C family)
LESADAQVSSFIGQLIAMRTHMRAIIQPNVALLWTSLLVTLSCSIAPKRITMGAVPVVPVVSMTVAAAESDGRVMRVENYLKELSATNGFNGTILFAHKGRIVFEDAMGFADFKSNDSMRLNTVFQLASVSKQFTAVSVMMLKEKGMLDYECTVQDFFPEFPYKNITIRHLLNHSSGLPNYTYFSDRFWSDHGRRMTNKDVIAMMTKHKPRAYFVPGKKYDYSNTGYCVLAAIVEKASGLPFDTYVRTNIFRPLGMNNSAILDLDGYRPASRSIGHDSLLHSEVENYYINGVTGDKGIYSTVEDLFKWDQALYTDRLIKQSTLQEAFKPAHSGMKGANYGFGWRILKNDESGKIVFHAGWWRGFRAYFVRDLKNENTLIMLSNVVNSDFDKVKNELTDLLTMEETTTAIAEVKNSEPEIKL